MVELAAAPVAIVMGSQSDWTILKQAADTLDALGIAHDDRIVSAHRTPDRLITFAKGARRAGYKVVIAAAGGAAHLPGMIAAMTPLPVLGVPIETKALGGQDSLYSIVQMPAGVPVGTLRHRPLRRHQRRAPRRRHPRPFRREGRGGTRPLAHEPVVERRRAPHRQ